MILLSDIKVNNVAVDGDDSRFSPRIPSQRRRDGIANRMKKVAYSFIKQLFDIAASALASVVLLVPMSLIALLIVIKDPGNPFYVHERVGRNGERLRLVKFRTMRSDAGDLFHTLTPAQIEEYHKEYKLADDPRLIGYKVPGDGKRCFGAALRRTSLDELPQLFFNIFLKHDMSIVGPRPILREEMEKYYTPQQQRKLLQRKPGLTGYWQAYARNNAMYADGKRQQMEMYYAEHASIWLDIKIICKTLSTIWLKNWVK